MDRPLCKQLALALIICKSSRVSDNNIALQPHSLYFFACESLTRARVEQAFLEQQRHSLKLVFGVEMPSLKQAPATPSKAVGDAERAQLSQVLEEIDSIEVSLDAQHVMLHSVASLHCVLFADDANRLNGCGFKDPGRDACAYVILKIVSAWQCRISVLVF